MRSLKHKAGPERASLAAAGNQEMRQLARQHARLALARFEQKLGFADDLKVLREVARPLGLDEQESWSCT